MHKCGILKNGTDEPIYRAGVETQTQRMDVHTRVWWKGDEKN